MVKKKEQEQQQAINEIFGAAPAAAAPKKTSKKKKAEEVEMPQGFDLYVALAVVENLIKEPKENIAAQMKVAAFDIFDEQVAEDGAIVNFTGVREGAAASVQCKNRHNGIPDEMRPLLDEHKIYYETIVAQEKRYVVNPEIVNNQELLGRLAIVLKNFDGPQVVLTQDPIVKLQATEQTIKDIQKVKNPEVRKSLLEGIKTIAFSYTKMSLDRAIETLKTMGIFKV